MSEELKEALAGWVKEWDAWNASDGEGSRQALEVAEMKLEWEWRQAARALRRAERKQKKGVGK